MQNINNMRAADKFIAVNIGVSAQFFNLCVGFFNHLVLRADGQSAGRTGFNTRGRKVFLNAGITQITFGNLFRFLVIARNIKGTGRNAFLAADAFFAMNTNCFNRRIIQSAAGANLHAGCVGAVHAAVFAEDPCKVLVFIFIFLKADQRPGIPLQIGRILVSAGLLCPETRHHIPLLAGDLAAAAGGAQGCINQFYKFGSHSLFSYTLFYVDHERLILGAEGVRVTNGWG